MSKTIEEALNKFRDQILGAFPLNETESQESVLALVRMAFHTGYMACAEGPLAEAVELLVEAPVIMGRLQKFTVPEHVHTWRDAREWEQKMGAFLARFEEAPEEEVQG